MIGAVIDLVMLEGKKKDATQRCQDAAAAPPMDAMEPSLALCRWRGRNWSTDAGRR